MHSHGLFHNALLAAVLALPVAAGAQNPVVAEQDLKAAYLYHFIQFTDWPHAAAASTTPTAAPSALTVCIDANHPLLPALQGLRNKPVHGTTLQLQSEYTHLEQCEVLLVAHDNFNAPLRDQAARLHVLTVSDDTAIAADDVIIALRVQDNRVLFSINKTRATLSGLNISSKLLRLAETVQ